MKLRGYISAATSVIADMKRTDVYGCRSRQVIVETCGEERLPRLPHREERPWHAQEIVDAS